MKISGNFSPDGGTTDVGLEVELRKDELRDLFAAFALVGCVAQWHDRGKTFAYEASRAAYEYADAMLAARDVK